LFFLEPRPLRHLSRPGETPLRQENGLEDGMIDGLLGPGANHDLDATIQLLLFD
jgi:hypothetical protein